MVLKPKVVSQFKLHQDALKILEEVAEVVIVPGFSHEDLMAEMSDADALIGAAKVDEAFLNQTPRLKIVASFGVGYQDRVDVEACTKRGIFVTYTPNALSGTVAELTMGLILCLARAIPVADAYVRRRWWRPKAKPLPLGLDIEGKTLGILGLGRIGYEVAKRAKAFGMRILYYDIVRNLKAEGEGMASYASLDDLLKASDFLTIHVPLVPETRKMIGERELRLMKRSAYIINMARGGIIDEEALCRALSEGWIAGAGLDVFAREPLPKDSPLIKMKNVVLTPHIGSATVEARRRMALMNATDVVRVLRGEEPINIVPEQRKRPPLKVSRGGAPSDV
ncbi:MAG: D-glycerate dehydrogenase [Candidatus Bathyarchaeia archaeon]